MADQDKADTGAVTRAGGDVVTKGASQDSETELGASSGGTEKDRGTRAGGDVVTKGASQQQDEKESKDTRAGGDVVTKGSSQAGTKQP